MGESVGGSAYYLWVGRSVGRSVCSCVGEIMLSSSMWFVVEVFLMIICSLLYRLRLGIFQRATAVRVHKNE